MTRPRSILLLALALGTGLPLAGQPVIHVDSRALGSGDGASWANAFISLQDALAAASAGDQIWVAEGTYRPDQGTGLTPGDRSLSFAMKSGVRIHGGFAGTEASIAERDLGQNSSVLSGDLAENDDGMALRDDNSFHVVRAAGVDGDALLDGFVVVGGNANGEDVDSLGGGILVESGYPWIVNTRINSSSAGCGGGIAVTGGGTPTIVNAVVYGNHATAGGGFCHQESSPDIINATVTSNSALMGPAMYNRASYPSIKNSIVTENKLSSDLDHCEYWQYPCSPADVSEDVAIRTVEVLEEASSALEAGTMDDAVAYLKSQSDVVQVFGNTTSIAVRVRGGSMAFLSDGSKLFSSEGGKTSARAGVSSTAIRSTRTGVPSNQADERIIVGEDLNGDGQFDNRDGKRALIMALLPSSTEAGAIADLVSSTRDYYSVKSLLMEQIGLSDFKTWDDYDFVYVSTVAVAVCDSTVASNGCTTQLATYLKWDPLSGEPGINVGKISGEAGVGITITPRFFRNVYNGSLDNAVVYCAGCDVRTGQWVQTLGTDSFELVGWTTHIPVETAVLSNLAMVERLVKGLNVAEASVDLNQTGLDYVQVPDNTVQFGYRLAQLWFESPVSLSRRLIEIPTLFYQPDFSSAGVTVLTDGQDISSMIEGVVGDESSDILRILLTVDGVNRPPPHFDVHFEVDNKEIPGLFDLKDAQPVEGFPFRYVAPINLDLGFPVKKGLLPIRAIVELYEQGADSRFAVVPSVDAFSCTNASQYEGGRNGAFSGPSQWNYVSLTLLSLDAPVASGEEFPGPNGHQATFYVAPSDSDNAQLDIIGGFVTPLNDPFESTFGTPPGTHCGDCGGTVTIDSTSADSTTWFGSVDFFGIQTDEKFTAAFKSKFKAVIGSSTNTTSPYFKCLTQYRTFWESTH